MNLLHRKKDGTVIQSIQPDRDGSGFTTWTSNRNTAGGYAKATFEIGLASRVRVSKMNRGDVIELWDQGTRLYQGLITAMPTNETGYEVWLNGIFNEWLDNVPAEGTAGPEWVNILLYTVLANSGPHQAASFGPYTGSAFSGATTYFEAANSYRYAGVIDHAKTKMRDVFEAWNKFLGREYQGTHIYPANLDSPCYVQYVTPDYSTVSLTVSAHDLAERPNIAQDFVGFGNKVRVYYAGGPYTDVADNGLSVAKYGLRWHTIDISGTGAVGADATQVAWVYQSRLLGKTIADAWPNGKMLEPWVKGQIVIDGTKRMWGALGISSIFQIRPGMNLRIMNLPDVLPELVGVVDNATNYHINNVEINPFENKATVTLNDWPDDAARMIARAQQI